LLPFLSAAETRTILILHTNDLHDHVRPGQENCGGMPYISGYIKSVKAQRQDVLVLDAGDVAEKGDMLAFKTNSDIMYQAMGKIGYAATVPGNHDLDHGVARLHTWAALAPGMTMLCLNYVDKEAKPCFTPSKIFDVKGIKVGVIGLTILKGNETMDRVASVERLRKEAARLRPETDLLLALCHAGTSDCAELSASVPSVQVFVGGHTHELLKEPKVVKDTGALIVQTGSDARYVGRLDLTVDLDSRKLVRAEGGVVEMRHDQAPCDDDMLAWISKREQEVCPEANHLVGRCEKPLGPAEVAALAAAALRWRAGADVALCHTATIMRSGLPAGDVDVNDLFLTGGQRGDKVVTLTLTGKAIESYLEGLMNYDKGPTEWAGFHAAMDRSGSAGSWSAHTDLDPEHEYRAVLPEQEWEKRFETVAKKQSEKATGQPYGPGAKPPECPFTFIDALTAYAESLAKENVTLDAHVNRLLSIRRLLPEPAEVK
jgi:2',3'-cyclic-nucleotide 2'-phosphodiesterase (5'-nucleotidase family)